MYSMTGFGRCELELDGRKISLELKSVNHRYLDINIRLPRSISYIEEIVKGALKERLSRGHVDMYIHYQNLRDDSKEVTVDEALLKSYHGVLRGIHSITGAENDITITALARMPDVLSVQNVDEDEDAVIELAKTAAHKALDGLIEMRSREGIKMAEDVMEKAEAMKKLVAVVEERSPMVVTEYRDKLRARVADLMKDVGAPLDENKLANEVTFFADRCSIAEEITRLNCHIEQLAQILDEDGAIGRRLDFLVQEMNREVNTICSKANDMTITNAGLKLKNEVEKIREQVQNLE